MIDPADQALLDGVLHAGGEAQRRAIAKTITLLESTRADHRARADELLNALLPASGRSFHSRSSLAACSCHRRRDPVP